MFLTTPDITTLIKNNSLFQNTFQVLLGILTTYIFSFSSFASPCDIGSVPAANNHYRDINTNSLLNHLQILSSNEFSGRKFSTAGNQLAQNYIITILKKLSITPFKGSYQHQFIQHNFFNNKQGTNIIGFIEGKKHANQFIVLSAHYDHLGSRGHKIYNGADDNASGTSALLAFAESLLLKPLDHSVILLFTDGEEVSLLGAKAFVTEQEKLLPQIKLNINIDMIAGSRKTKVLHYIDYELDKLLQHADQQKLDNCQKSTRFTLKKGFARSRGVQSSAMKTNWHTASDHGVFYQNKIPFIYFGVGTHKNYHTEKDNYENINVDFFKFSVNEIYQRLLFIDKNIIFPTT